MEEPLNSEWHGKGEEQVRSTERTRRGTAVAEESIGNFQSKEPQLYHLHAELAVRHDGLSEHHQLRVEDLKFMIRRRDNFRGVGGMLNKNQTRRTRQNGSTTTSETFHARG